MNPIQLLKDCIATEIPNAKTQVSEPLYESIGVWFLDIVSPGHWFVASWSIPESQLGILESKPDDAPFSNAVDANFAKNDFDSIIAFIRDRMDKPSPWEGVSTPIDPRTFLDDENDLMTPERKLRVLILTVQMLVGMFKERPEKIDTWFPQLEMAVDELGNHAARFFEAKTT